MSWKGRRLTISAALVALVALVPAAIAAERATVVRAGNLVLRIDGGVTPKRLPKARLAPIALRVSSVLGTVDGAQPPVTKTVRIDFDRHGTINARGLPACRAGQLQSRDTKRAERACPRAIVGRGRTTVRVALPEQTPFYASGPLVAFNGGVRGGTTTLYVHAYVSVPTPTALVTPVKITRIHKGRFGTRALARIPTIAGGSGALTKFSLRLKRGFRRGGHEQSYLLARCADGRFVADATASFADGSRIAGQVVRRCQARR